MEIVFRPSIFMSISGILGFPLFLVCGLAMIGGGAFILIQIDSPLEINLAAIACIALGMAFVWLAVFCVRIWYVFFTEYVLTAKGVLIRQRSNPVFLPWSQLQTARFRRATQLLELGFFDVPRKVILLNLDLDLLQTRLQAAVRLVEAHAPIPVKRVLL